MVLIGGMDQRFNDLDATLHEARWRYESKTLHGVRNYHADKDLPPHALKMSGKAGIGVITYLTERYSPSPHVLSSQIRTELSKQSLAPTHIHTTTRKRFRRRAGVK